MSSREAEQELELGIFNFVFALIQSKTARLGDPGEAVEETMNWLTDFIDKIRLQSQQIQNQGTSSTEND